MKKRKGEFISFTSLKQVADYIGDDTNLSDNLFIQVARICKGISNTYVQETFLQTKTFDNLFVFKRDGPRNLGELVGYAAFKRMERELTLFCAKKGFGKRVFSVYLKNRWDGKPFYIDSVPKAIVFWIRRGFVIEPPARNGRIADFLDFIKTAREDSILVQDFKDTLKKILLNQPYKKDPLQDFDDAAKFVAERILENLDETLRMIYKP